MFDIFKSKARSVKTAVQVPVRLKLDFLNEKDILYGHTGKKDSRDEIKLGPERIEVTQIPADNTAELSNSSPNITNVSGDKSQNTVSEIQESDGFPREKPDNPSMPPNFDLEIKIPVGMVAGQKPNDTDSKSGINAVPLLTQNCTNNNIDSGQNDICVETAASALPQGSSDALQDLKSPDPKIDEVKDDVKDKEGCNDVVLKILEIARDNPCDYGWKRHSLRNLQKYLIDKKIVESISHETIRKILAENNIRWKGNGYHNKKNKLAKEARIEEKTGEKTAQENIVDEQIKMPDITSRGAAIPSDQINSQSQDVQAQMAPSSNQVPSIIQPYNPMVLTDYLKPAAIIKNELSNKVQAIIENPPGAANNKKQSDDIDVPPGIINDVNNIKIFGPDFDPDQLDIVDSYTIPHPIENPSVYIVRDGFKLRYLIKEPAKPDVYNSVHQAILRNVDIYPLDGKDPAVRLSRIIEVLKKKYAELKNLGKDEERHLMYYLYRDFTGYREIDIPMRDDLIEDITCVGYGIPVFIYHQKHYNLVSDIIFQEYALDSMVLRMAQESGKHISISNPIVDATLKNSSRAQLTFKKTATDKGSTFTVRKFRSSHITPIDLIRKGTYSLEAMAYLWRCVQSGKNILFAGGTATGKTTNLNACSFFIPPEVKIVSIEDTREIRLYQKNWIPSVTAKDIDVFQLLKAALRQRPEYIIVGEVRGREAQTLFQAMSSGHIVMSTFHAGSVEDLINRLTSPPIEVPSAMLESLGIVVILKNEWTGVSSRHRFADAIYEQRRIGGVPRFVKVYDHAQGLSASLMTPELEHKIMCLQAMVNEKLDNPDRVSERIVSHMYTGVK